MKKVLIIICLLMLLTPTIALANIPGPADCSPGFWKNHTEIWAPTFDPDAQWGTSGFTRLEALQGGHDTRVVRFQVTDFLNAAFPEAACDDDLISP